MAGSGRLVRKLPTRKYPKVRTFKSDGSGDIGG